jgi:hypothetical protein
MNIDIEGIVTSGEIAKSLDIPCHRVAYYLRTRHIEPVRWLGKTRLFAAEAVDELRA